MMAHPVEDDVFPRMVKATMYLCMLGWIASIWMCTRLPPSALIRKELFNQPLQQGTTRDTFYYTYKGQSITVTPVADYTISGVIVSHNDPKDWWRFDLVHDDRSLDTRDICLVWGSNLKHDDYRRAHFHSDDWMCNWQYGSDVHYLMDNEISNNHLITDSDAIRDIINHLQIGDQITIRGMLANYSEERWDGQFRTTSLTREDTGNGACEIIFVRDIVVLHSYNGRWARLKEICFWGLIVSLGLRLARFLTHPGGTGLYN